MDYYEEQIKQEIKTMKAKRAFALQANDYDAFRSLIDELCAFTVKKQMDNQTHTPDGFSGVTEIETKPFAIACDAYNGECCKLTKGNGGHWDIATNDGICLPVNTLSTEALRAASIALLDTIAGIHAWEQEWM